MSDKKPESKPRISKCGNHWNVEWNRRGDWYPQWICGPSFEWALGVAAKVIRERKQA